MTVPRGVKSWPQSVVSLSHVFPTSGQLLSVQYFKFSN